MRKQNNGVGGEKMGRKEEGFNAPPANGRRQAGTLPLPMADCSEKS